MAQPSTSHKALVMHPDLRRLRLKPYPLSKPKKPTRTTDFERLFDGRMERIRSVTYRRRLHVDLRVGRDNLCGRKIN